MASSVFSRTTRRRPTAPLFLPLRISLGLYGCWAHRKGWREGLLWTAPLCGEAKSKLCPELVSDVECSAAPEPGAGKFRFSRGTEFVGLGDDAASLLWSCEKQFSTKELQEAPLPKNHRKLQENHNVFNEYSRQNASAIDRAQITYLEKHRLFNQMLGSRSRINNRNIL